MKSRTTPQLAMAASLAFALAACSQKAPDTATNTNMAEPVAAMTGNSFAADNTHAAQFLTDAMKGDNSEVMLGQLAVDQASGQGVKDFGRMLVEDHGKAKDEVTALARSMNVEVTDETKPEADAEFEKLKELKGAAFDKEFISYMIDDHKKDIAKFQEEVSSGDPGEVTALARNTIPTLQKHLEKGQSLR